MENVTGEEGWNEDHQGRSDRDSRTHGEVIACAEAYEGFSTAAMSHGGASIGLLISADAFVFETCANTLRSIASLLRLARVNDAYALLRKYYDVIVIDTYKNCYVDRERADGRLIAEQVANWVRGDDRLPELKPMVKFIARTVDVSAIHSLVVADGRYKSLRDRCNDHLHYNFFGALLLNATDAFTEPNREAATQAREDALDLFALHLAYVVAKRGYYLAASDHLDHLELGKEPPAGSQVWVAPFAQAVFDATVGRRLPRVADLLRSTTYMDLA